MVICNLYVTSHPLLTDTTRFCIRSAQQLLQQLTAQLENQQPHFGSRLAGQLLQQAGSAVQQAGSAVQQQFPATAQQLPRLPVQLSEVQFPAAPQLPSVQLPNLQDVELPHVQLPDLHPPTVQMPAVQFPSVQLPANMQDGQALLQSMADSARRAADDVAHLPATVQQRLELLQQQLVQLATSTESSSFEPHSGTKAFTAWLQEVVQTLSSALHLPVLHLTAASSLGSHITLDGSSGSSLAGLAAVSTAATVDSIRTSMQVLLAAAYNSLPAEVSSIMIQSASTLQEQSASALAGVQQLQDSVAHLQQMLEQLPESGMGGYDLPTICFIAAGAVAATAASVPAEGAVVGGEDDIRDVLTHDYDADVVAAYFKRRPVLVAQRSLQLAAEMAKFGLALLMDLWTNRLQVRRPLRPDSSC